MKLNNKQKSALRKIAEKYGLKLIILFGSFASGTNREGSDFDVAVDFRKLLTNDRRIKLENDQKISCVSLLRLARSVVYNFYVHFCGCRRGPYFL